MKALEKPIQISGRDYVLSIDFNTLCDIEAAHGHRSIFDIFANLTLTMLGKAFHIMISKRHPMSLDQAGALIDEAGVEDVADWVTGAALDYLGSIKATPLPKSKEPAEA